MSKTSKCDNENKIADASYLTISGRSKARSQYKSDYITAKDLEDIYAEYKQDCVNLGRKPTYEGYCLAVGVTKETLDRWEEKYKDKSQSDVIKKIKLDLADEIQQNKDAMSIFRLKQPVYGGYQDKQSNDNSNQRIDIHIGGLGKDVKL